MQNKILSPKGNFKTVSAANTWLKQLASKSSSNNTFNNLSGNTVIVRGSNSVSPTTSLVYNTPVCLSGEGGSLTFTGASTLKNIKFKDLTINIQGLMTIT